MTRSADIDSITPSGTRHGANGHQALDASVDGVVVISEDGTLTAMNPAAEAMFGQTLEEMSGQQLLGMIPEAAPPSADDAHKEYVFVVRDLRQTDLAFKRILRAERRAAVEQVLAVLAHDSRNALQRMQSCLTLLKLRGDPHVQTLVDDMQDTQDRLLRLYEEAQLATAPLQLERRQADVRKLVERTWRQLRLRWSEKALDWAVQLECPDTKAFIDPQRLGQALRSVLENAIEVSPSNERVACVFTRGADGGRPVLEIAIEDSGPALADGLKAQARGFLYEARRGGAGLGLAVAQRIIDEHDGSIRIDNSSDARVRVMITLPYDGKT